MEPRYCPCCGAKLDLKTQPWPHRAPTILATCWNKRCKVSGRTVTLAVVTAGLEDWNACQQYDVRTGQKLK